MSCIIFKLLFDISILHTIISLLHLKNNFQKFHMFRLILNVIEHNIIDFSNIKSHYLILTEI